MRAANQSERKEQTQQREEGETHVGKFGGCTRVLAPGGGTPRRVRSVSHTIDIGIVVVSERSSMIEFSAGAVNQVPS